MKDPVTIFDLSGIHQNYKEEEPYFESLVSNFRWTSYPEPYQRMKFISSESIRRLLYEMNLDLSKFDYILLPLWGATIFDELLISNNIKKIYAPVSRHPSVTLCMEEKNKVREIMSEYSIYKRNWAEQVREAFNHLDCISILILDEIHDTGGTMNRLEQHLRRLCPHKKLTVERGALFHVKRIGKAPPEYFAVNYELPEEESRLVIQKTSHVFFQLLPRLERKALEKICREAGLNFDYNMKRVYSFGDYASVVSSLRLINHYLISLEEMKERYFKIPRE